MRRLYSCYCESMLIFIWSWLLFLTALADESHERQYYFLWQLFAPKRMDRQRHTTVDRDTIWLTQTNIQNPYYRCVFREATMSLAFSKSQISNKQKPIDGIARLVLFYGHFDIEFINFRYNRKKSKYKIIIQTIWASRNLQLRDQPNNCSVEWSVKDYFSQKNRFRVQKLYTETSHVKKTTYFLIVSLGKLNLSGPWENMIALWQYL